MSGFRKKWGECICLLFKVHTDNSEEGFFGNFHRGQVNPNQPLFKIIIATGREFEDFCVKGAIVVIHLRFFVGSSFIIITIKKNKVKSCGS